MTGRRWAPVWLALALVVGAGIGGGSVWNLERARGSRPDIREGYATIVNESGTAIGFARAPGGAGEGVVIAGALWRDADGPWHDSFPTCLRPLTGGQRVRLGVVDVRPIGDKPGRPVVAWLECLR